MQLKKSIASAILAISISQPAGAAWWASEWTQVANNVLLGKSLAEQAAMVAQEIQTATNTLNTYKAAMQNLMGLPQSLMSEMLSPFQAELAAFYKVGAAVDGLYSSTMDAQAVYQKYTNDMERLADGGFDPQYYFAREAQLASRNQEAKKRYEADREAIKKNEEQLKKVADIAANTPNINSTVSGMQQLSTLSALMAAEQAETNKILNQNRADESIKSSAMAAHDQQRAERAKAEREQDLKDMEKLSVPADKSKFSNYDLKYKTYK